VVTLVVSDDRSKTFTGSLPRRAYCCVVLAFHTQNATEKAIRKGEVLMEHATRFLLFWVLGSARTPDL
jgi:hypothetical protein